MATTEINDRLFVSFSGGRTSGYMAKRLKDEYADTYELVFVFANTGEEHEKTLIFVDRCDKEFGLNVVWVEAVTHHGERIGCTHKVVTFETAARNGEPFEDMIRKYGIPNKAYPHCTRELKANAMRSYAASIGWETGTFKFAVGIRADEPARLSEVPDRVYPLAHWFPITKRGVLQWWSRQTFDLGLEAHQGNCKWCWKKSLKKHGMLVRESPEVFDFPAQMERLYGLSGYNEDGNPRVFFRGNMSTADLIQITLGSPLETLPDFIGPTCSESCEAFA
jgi:hypothetical protein